MDANDDKQAGAAVDVQLLTQQLDALQPDKQQMKILQFQKPHQAIEHAAGRNSMGGFRSLLGSERKLQTENGNLVRCEHCASNLPCADSSGSTPE
jgi:hypothetical protein